MIDSAEKSIDLETFFIYQGHGTDLILNALANKVKQGIKVRILVDGYMMKKKNRDNRLKKLADELGFELRFFNESKLKPNRRDHRKILCIDKGQKGCLVGGRNIADEYWAMSNKFHHFDRDIYIEGEINKYISLSFEQYWKSCLTKEIKRRRNEKFLCNNNNEYFKSQRQLLENIVVNNEAYKSIEGNCQEISFVSDSPYKNEFVSKSIVNAINSAQSEIIIETPTWILQKTNTKLALEEALLKRHIQVKAMFLGGQADNLVVSIFNEQDAKRFSGLGVKSYAHNYIYLEDQEYNFLDPAYSKTPFLFHSKMFLIDPNTEQSTIAIGSFNVDPRSDKLNCELMIFCKPDRKTITQLANSSLFWMEKAHEIDCKGCGYNKGSQNNHIFRNYTLKVLLQPFKFLF